VRNEIRIRPLDAATDAEACDAIIRGLPEWFGMEAGIRDCARAVRTQDGLVAVDRDEVVGFVTFTTEGAVAEITWMGIKAGRRRQGAGRALTEVLVERLRREGLRRLHVKTLSAREPYAPYAETRTFYRSMGFAEQEELDIWGPGNPAVLLARDL
jgi:ribosomal protein S18 acetylase RimI-like enzyme